MHRFEGRSWHFLCVCMVALLLCGLPARAAPPSLLLAEVMRGEVDLRHYWVSEKLDGVRAVWDGQTLRFRSGNPVPAPGWFLAGLPAEPLDGELWMGRGRFDALSAAVRRNVPQEAEWRQIHFMVFEQPGGSGSFTERVARLRDIVTQAGVPWLQAVEQFRLPDDQALQARLAEVVAGGGEGLMLHRDDAAYVTGRSDVLLKLKPWLDTEARVIGHVPGKGRLAGMLGALRVETPEGRHFNIGSGLSDAQRRDPPQVGAQVAYRYTSLTPDGLPRFPRFLRVREAF